MSWQPLCNPSRNVSVQQKLQAFYHRYVAIVHSQRQNQKYSSLNPSWRDYFLQHNLQAVFIYKNIKSHELNPAALHQTREFQMPALVHQSITRCVCDGIIPSQINVTPKQKQVDTVYAQWGGSACSSADLQFQTLVARR